MAINKEGTTSRKARLLEGHEDTPLYSIGVASRLLGCDPSALRRYEKAGLIEPQRTGGNTRLYSENQLERLRDIQGLIEVDDVNMAGINIILSLKKEVEDLKEEIAVLRKELAFLKDKANKKDKHRG
ncbi:MAG: MerR family transcriptional regulator [Actinomycetota bacterium]